MFSLEAMYPWAQGLTNRQKSHFRGIKMSNIAQRYSHNPEPRVSGHFRNPFFRPSKCRRRNETKIPLIRVSHGPCRIPFSGGQNALEADNEVNYPGVEDFRTGISTVHLRRYQWKKNIFEFENFNSIYFLGLLSRAPFWSPGLFLKLFCGLTTMSILTFRLPFLLLSSR